MGKGKKKREEGADKELFSQKGRGADGLHVLVLDVLVLL